ncbi:hypothetical protein OS175_09635 [Marinicella sp. S1101]|nr:hypothetical protein [Marinicella marina]
MFTPLALLRVQAFKIRYCSRALTSKVVALAFKKVMTVKKMKNRVVVSDGLSAFLTATRKKFIAGKLFLFGVGSIRISTEGGFGLSSRKFMIASGC